MTLHPVADPLSWARLLFGMTVVLGVPGYWILGRFSRAQWPVRVVLSLATGFLGAAGAGLLGAHLRLPFVPWTYFIGVGLLGVALGLLPVYRRAIAELVDAEVRLSTRQWWLVALVCALMAATVVQLQGGFPVPPSRHDAGNHAFMVLRIVETGSTSPEQIYAAPWGHPQLPYFPGWHPAAALVGRCAGLPPHVALWLLSLSTLILLPGTLVVIWRTFRLSGAVAVLAAALVLVNGDLLIEIPGYGGLGQMVAMYCLCLPFLALVGAVRRGSLVLAALAGAALACLLRVHASWTVVALLLALACLWRLGRPAIPVGRRVGPVVAVTLSVFVLIVIWDSLPAAAAYRERAYNAQDLLPLATGIRLFARSIGVWWPLEVLGLIAIVVGLLRRELRPLAVLSLALGLLSVGLASWQDPLSMWLGQPWYQVYKRLHKPQVLLLAPLVAWLLWEVLHRGPPWLRARLAAQIPAVVGEDELVANWRSNGSCWAMHLSGRRFLIGANWVLGEREGLDHREAIRALSRGRWTPAARGLWRQNVHYVWATSHGSRADRPPVLDRRRLRTSKCFTPVLDGEFSTLFRIEWERCAGPRARPPRTQRPDR